MIHYDSTLRRHFKTGRAQEDCPGRNKKKSRISKPQGKSRTKIPAGVGNVTDKGRTPIRNDGYSILQTKGVHLKKRQEGPPPWYRADGKGLAKFKEKKELVRGDAKVKMLNIDLPNGRERYGQKREDGRRVQKATSHRDSQHNGEVMKRGRWVTKEEKALEGFSPRRK